MEKTKLGISVGLCGAALYFFGLINSIIPLVLGAGYVLLFEQNEWLKKAAVKAVAVVVSFSIVLACIGLIGNSFSLLTDVVYLFNGTINLSSVNRLLSICRTLVSFVQAVFLLMLGFKALKQGDVSIDIVDKTVKGNM